MTIRGETRLGHYALVREAGRGAMSTVYEAVDTRLGRTVALKVLAVPAHSSSRDHEALTARMEREARAISRLSHPNVVTIFDLGEQDGLHYLVMEFLDGVTLRARLDTGPLAPGEAADVLRQVADGLDAVHAQGVLHRDIKPANVMLLPGGHVKLMDFGVARGADDTTMTQAGMMVGSPAYLAPELVEGQRGTPASDVWALGVLLYEMLAGRPPFAGESIPSVLYQIAHSAAPTLPGASPAVAAVLAQSLEKDPARRYPSARALADAFRDALAPAEAAVAAPTKKAVKSPPRRPRPTAPRAALPPDADAFGEADTLHDAPSPRRAQRPSRRRPLWPLAAAGIAAIAAVSLFLSRPRTPVAAGSAEHRVARATIPAPATAPAPAPRSRPAPRKSAAPPPAAAATEKPSREKPARRPSITNPPGPSVRPRAAAMPTVARPAPARPSPAATRPNTPARRPSPPQQTAPRKAAAVPTPKASPAPKTSSTPKASPVPKVPKTSPATPSPKTTARSTDNRNWPESETRGKPEVPAVSETRDVPAARDAPETVAATLLRLRDAWIAATNSRDIAAQMRFYPARMDNFYRNRNESRAAVRAEKIRVIGRATRVEIEGDTPQTTVSPNGDNAVMRFRKRYVIAGPGRDRRGEVLQELRWRRIGGEWKIVSERDLRVLKPER